MNIYYITEILHLSFYTILILQLCNDSALLGDNVNRFAEEDAAGPTGGYPWSCGGEGAISKSVEPLLQSL